MPESNSIIYETLFVVAMIGWNVYLTIQSKSANDGVDLIQKRVADIDKQRRKPGSSQ
ncbi:MAG: hypothetical protein AAFN70_09200 [Planctomycetota bacterium]